ncbi:MAG: hypothetical protein A2Z99_17645 [Treponema sp. GWB1_62_6]|nr:MAG: hypothetical protein A2001_00890 [Treponema sp. GWC1_61_84]OHE65124.1 MAG: hypothetical protein A2Y36_18880 [Treponema sp. GWA1_62_8]OHE68687.1 MAG: hypothetical protein A2413_09330 [Treponema sp. RIFOXYC1_FULL_61_9]OHE72190.1 MAG: hypothetical protein A2Z99_17645 [Treponema sp. GWB1_62_6]HCM28002.1 hypothetical protein [Treponema sp.]
MNPAKERGRGMRAKAAVLAAAAAAITIAVVSAVPASAQSAGLLTMRELRAAADEAMDTNHPVEALRHLVALLAVDEESPAGTNAADPAADERRELARKADAELAAIGARLTLEPMDEWLAGGTQIAGNVRDLAKGAGLMPSARLVVNYDFGKAVVADAPIRFAFADGIGEVTGRSVSDSSGVVSAVVRSVARTDKPVVIRAVLAVTERGKTRVFREVFLDFTYLPAVRAARVMALETASGSQGPAAGARSPLVDAVSRGLSRSGVELFPADASSDPQAYQAAFLAAFGGSREAVASALAAAASGGRLPSYLVMALAEYEEPRRMVYQGKTYDIYTSNARGQLRIVRSDGSVAASRPALSARGQGGSPEAAIQAALAAIRAQTEKDLSEHSGDIARSFD